MSVLNRIPKGMLDLFGSITQGRNPPAYVDAVAPVVDIGELYLGETGAVYGGSVGHAAFGVSFSMTVGLNETWLLRGLAVETGALPTTGRERWLVRAGDFPRRPENAGAGTVEATIIHAFRDLSSSNVNQTDGDAVIFDSPIVLHPGTNLTYYLAQRDGGASRTTTFSALIHLLNS